jgi:hypothetical protein
MSSTVDNENQTNPQKEVLRKELLELNTKRDKIEKEIKEWLNLLQSVGLFGFQIKQLTNN